MRLGAEAEARGALQAMERDLAVQQPLPLYEPLYQLLCHGVPNTVKAATNDALAALARFPDLAPRLLDRLLACAVVAPAPAVAAFPGACAPAGGPRVIRAVQGAVASRAGFRAPWPAEQGLGRCGQ